MIPIKTTILFLTVISCHPIAQEPPPAAPAPVNLLQRRGLPQGLIPGYYPLYVLMDNARVREELQLTDDQAAELKVIRKNQTEADRSGSKDLEARRSEVLAKLRQTNKDTQDFPKLDAELGEIEQQQRILEKDMGDLFDRQVLKLLDRKQGTRLKEIRIQAEGPSAFDQPNIQTALDLLPEQITEIKRINFQYSKKLRTSAFVKPPQPNPGTVTTEASRKDAEAKAIRKTHSNMANVRVDTMKAIEKVLTNSQRKIYKKMVGESFDFLGYQDQDPTEPTKDGKPINNDKADPPKKSDRGSEGNH